MKTILTLTTIAALSITANGFLLKSSITTGHMVTASLEDCAKRLNVYQCQLVPQAVEAPRVIIQQATLLPPPVL